MNKEDLEKIGEEARLKEFLLKLADLCQEYGANIHSCGCCYGVSIMLGEDSVDSNQPCVTQLQTFNEFLFDYEQRGFKIADGIITDQS